ncbi:MAG: hypothetical protein DMG52_33425 [Acidobacteria bacterium]|nr:MAG: hypothetical protein DMG52_33425 [Acidobacteriota bacterium]
MNGDEPVPYFESILGVSVCRLIPNHIDVSLFNGGQEAVKSKFDARTGTQEAGEGFCSPLGVSFDGMAHFGESRLKFPLIQPNVRRSRIQRQRKKVGVNGARAVGVLEVVLPITAQEIPVLRFSRLQMHGALISFRRLQTSIMSSECISNAEVRED